MGLNVWQVIETHDVIEVSFGYFDRCFSGQLFAVGYPTPWAVVHYDIILDSNVVLGNSEMLVADVSNERYSHPQRYRCH